MSGQSYVWTSLGVSEFLPSAPDWMTQGATPTPGSQLSAAATANLNEVRKKQFDGFVRKGYIEKSKAQASAPPTPAPSRPPAPAPAQAVVRRNAEPELEPQPEPEEKAPAQATVSDELAKMKEEQRNIEEERKKCKEQELRLAQLRAIQDEGFTLSKATDAVNKWGDDALVELRKVVQAIVSKDFTEKQAKEAIRDHGDDALNKLVEARRLHELEIERKKLADDRENLEQEKMVHVLVSKGFAKEQAEEAVREHGNNALVVLEREEGPDADQTARVEKIKKILAAENSYVHNCKYYLQGSWSGRQTTFAFNIIPDGIVVGHAFNSFCFSLIGKLITKESLKFEATAESGNKFSFTFQWVDDSWKGKETVQDKRVELKGIEKAAYMVALREKNGKQS